MENNFISYEYIFNNFQPEDVFYDKELRKYTVTKIIKNGSIKEIRVIDNYSTVSSIFNYTKLTRILLSMGISSRMKDYVFWDKPLLLSEDFADELIDEQHKEIIEEYKNMLSDGLQKGLIGETEYIELLERVEE